MARRPARRTATVTIPLLTGADCRSDTMPEEFYFIDFTNGNSTRAASMPSRSLELCVAMQNEMVQPQSLISWKPHSRIVRVKEPPTIESSGNITVRPEAHNSNATKKY